MQRTNIYLSQEQLDLLRRLGAQRDTPVATLVREAIDEWLKKQGVKPIAEDEWRRRFGDLLARRARLARDRGWSDAEVDRDVNAAVRDVRRARAARRS